MSVTGAAIEAPLAPDELARRWQALCADPMFEDVAGKIELTEWGEILLSPVGKMTEVGVATSIGVRAPVSATQSRPGRPRVPLSFGPGSFGVEKPSMTRKIERTVAAMVRDIVRRFSPEKIILFGSHATGSAGPDSDVDLLIVMSPAGTKAQQEIEIRRALCRYRMPKDIIVTTPEAFEWRKSVPGTIERPAAREGRIVYERR